MTRYRSRSRRREEIKAILFATFLAFITMGSLMISVASAGPFVLGTEMNSNGTVEYLCLGNGCENLATMDW